METQTFTTVPDEPQNDRVQRDTDSAKDVRWHGLSMGARPIYGGTAYRDRAAPRFARAKFLAVAFTRGLVIERGPGSNRPGWIFWPGRSALASRFLAFCPAFAFARWRALALVMSSSPF